MRTGSFLIRRAGAQLGTLATLAVLIATVAAILAGAVGYTRAASVATVRATLEEAPPAAAGIQVQTRLGQDPDAQDTALHSTLARLLPGVDLDITRALRTEAAAADLVGGEPAADDGGQGRAPVRVVLGELPADDDVVVVTGELPGAGQVLAPEQSAAEAGLAAGARFVWRGTELTVTGTWTPTDAEHRDWFADPMVAAGVDGSTYGPLLAGADTITATDPAPFVRWTIHPRAGSLTVADLPGLSAGLGRLDYALGQDDAIAVRGLTVEGGLAQTVAELERATSTAAAVGLVPVALLASISLIALVQVVRLLGQTRAREIEILVTRGASARQITRWSALELAVVVLLASALGTVVATLVVGRLDGGSAQREIITGVGVAVAAVAVGTGTLVAGLQARSIAGRMVADRSGRLQSAAAVGTVVLATAAAALSAWQLLRHGTPLIAADDGATRADVLAVVSLGAVLGALAMGALALLGPVTRLLAGLRARSRTLVGLLATRQVSRRVRAYAVPLVLMVLAAASTTVAASFAGATSTQRDHVSALSTGTDVRVGVPVGATSRLARPQSVLVAPYADLPGVAGAGAVVRGSGTFGELPVALTALHSGRVEDVMRVPEQIDLAAAVAGLRAPATETGVPVPAGTRTLALTVRAHAHVTAEARAAGAEAIESSRELLLAQDIPEAEVEEMLAQEAERRRVDEVEVDTVAWVVDHDGAPSMIELGALTIDQEDTGGDDVPRPVEHTLTAQLPGPGKYRIVAVDVDLPRPELDLAVGYEVLTFHADGQPLPFDGPSWGLTEPPEAAKIETAGTIGISGLITYDWQTSGPLVLRLVPGEAPTVVPAVISQPLARAADLDVGADATVNFRGTPVTVTVTGVVPAIPGGLEEHAALVDLETVTRHLLGGQDGVLLPGEVWLTTEAGIEPAAVAAAARELAGARGSVELAGDELTDSAASVRETFWIAAGGAVLLALTGVAAVALALARERRSEVMVLRALGLSPGGQARSRSAELLGVGLLGAVFGLLAGWAASALLVPTLARAAATQNTPLPLGAGRLDPLPALVLLVALGVGLVVVVGVVGARVRAQALDADYREEVR